MHPEIFLILFVIHLAQAAFNQTTANSTWSDNSVQPNEAGTFCYFPGANQTNATYCSGGHSEDPSFQPVLNIHLNLSQGWSIAYYSKNNALQTLCMSIDYNNNIAEAGSYCQVKLGQTYVSDGCYTAMTNTTSTATSTKPSSTSTSSSDPNPTVGTIIIPIVVGVMSLLGGWSVAYCTNPWCRQQTGKLCCCICGRLADRKKGARYAAVDEGGTMLLNYESAHSVRSPPSPQKS